MYQLLPIALLLAGAAAPQSDPLAVWRSGVKVHPATPHRHRHTIHTYFNVSPESPDGRWLLYYTSATPDGQYGDIRILERATGKERILARNVTTEDAHRAACQQWVSNGKRVVFHDLRHGTWMIVAVDVATGKERVLTKDRLVSWGVPTSDIVPIYGKHWDPGSHRDLELLNVATGAIRTTATAAGVRQTYPEAIAKRFGGRPISVFFPILSPDQNRVVFKLATPAGGDFRSNAASDREMLIGYDLTKSRFLFLLPRWGHPAWFPDSRHVLNVGGAVVDSEDGSTKQIPGLPRFRGSHPSVSPQGNVYVTDTLTTEFGGPPNEWGVAVVNVSGEKWVMIHRFDGSRGAKSWRRSHPHPVFSSDGRRIYFNMNASEWTQLYVAEMQ
ncbi:MAG: hypothetical protein M1436_03070 [Acidobacteria bacterium]|nr:hypothetical protein [Acidobacteriota bacterium]